MRDFRFRPLFLLPTVTLLVSGAVIWAGISLAKQERIERLEWDQTPITDLSRTIQERLDSLEALYQSHLEALCRSDLNDHFELIDKLDGLVGIRQLSTLNLNGRVTLHSSSTQAAGIDRSLPVPVLNEEDLPIDRSVALLVAPADLEQDEMKVAARWFERDGHLFFHLNVSQLRSVFVLVDRKSVSDAMAESVLTTVKPSFKKMDTKGFVTVSINGEPLISNSSGRDNPDLTRQLATRFGDWQVQTRDPKHVFVTYDLGIITGTIFLSLLVLIAGAIATLTLHRALRLAEQRVSFVNRVSHELKTPLTNILLNADLAADGADARGRQRLARVQEETRRLARLIDNVLAFSRRDSTAQPAPAPLALRPLVEEVSETFSPSLKRRGVEIVVNGGESTRALADADSLRQILGNLLSNIEKYAATGGLADITLAEQNENVILLIKDLGPGIPAREHERIFLPFHRLDDRTSEGVTGTGLGLAIARDLAVALDGSLRLVPQDGPGATFELRLPAAVAAKVITFPDSRAS